MAEYLQNYVWRLRNYPEGIDFRSALTLDIEDAPEASEGEVVIANQWLSLDAGTRTWMTPWEGAINQRMSSRSSMVRRNSARKPGVAFWSVYVYTL